MKVNMVIMSLIVVIIAVIIIGIVQKDVFVAKIIDEQTARKIASDYAYSNQKGIDWTITSVTLKNDIWTIVLNGQTKAKVMEIKINRNTGKIIESKTCCG